MAVVGCGHCGWTREVDEELSLEQIEATAAKLYAEHLLQDHPALTHLNETVSAYIRYAAEHVAPTNGKVIG